MNARTIAARLDHGVTAFAVTTITALWVTRAFWWPGSYVESFDSYTYSGPNLAVTDGALSSGRLALWNDSIFGGVSHLGNPQAGTLYPPRLLLLLSDEHRTLGLLSAGSVLLLGLGVVALTRRLGLGVLAAATAGCLAVLNGAVLTKSVQFEQILVLAWTPWLLVTTHATLTGRRPWPAVAATAGVTAATLLAGHPQLVFETIVVAVAGTIAFVDPTRLGRLVHLAVGAALGALIALPQLIGAAVATRESVLHGGRDDVDLLDPSLALVPGAAARALFGTVTDRDPAGFVGSFESVAFVGVAVVVMAVVGVADGVLRPARRRWTLSFAASAAVMLVWSLGPRTPVFTVASRVVPGFDLARGSARWLVVVVLLVVVLAAAGLDAVGRGVDRRALVAAVTATVVAGVIVAVRSLEGDDGGLGAEWLLLAGLTLALVAAGTSRRRTGAAAALAIIAVGSLALSARHSFPEQLATGTPFTSAADGVATTAWLRGQDGFTISFTDDLRAAEYGVPGLRPNANVLVDVPSIDGYDGGVQVTERWAAALRRFTPDPVEDLPLRNNVTVPLDPAQLGRLGVRFVLVDRTRPVDQIVPDWEGPRAADDRFEVWENPSWVAEALAWRSAAVLDPAEAPDLLRERLDELASTALVDALAEPLECRPSAACAPVPLRVDRSTPERFAVAVDLPDRSVVSVAQQYDPGWAVSVDGEDADVLEVDGLFMGVEVAAGPHEITWRYRPGWLTPALGISVLAIAATLAIVVVPPLAPAAGITRRG